MAATGTFDLSTYGAALQAAVAKPIDFGPLMRRIAVQLRSDALTCFSQARSPDGAPWAPLKPATVKGRGRRKGKSKKQRGKSAKPLQDTGILMMSVTAVGARGHVEDTSKALLVFGTNLSYAGYHQYGTKHIPARPFVGVSARGLKIIEEMCADFAAAKLAGQSVPGGGV